MSDPLNGAKEMAERAKEKAAPALDNLKEKVAEAQEKAAPVVEKVKSGVSDAADAVREGVSRVGNLLNGGVAAPEVKNPLFDELEQQAREKKDAAKDSAEEMQRKLEEMMRGLGGK